MSEQELNILIEEELKECSPELAKVFEKYKIKPILASVAGSEESRESIGVGPAQALEK